MGKKEWEARMRNSLEGGKEELKCCFGLPFLVCRSRETVFVEERPCCQSMSNGGMSLELGDMWRFVVWE